MGRTIYDKPVKEFFRDLVLKADHPLSKDEIIDYFSKKYPLVERNTVIDHIYWLTANNPKRTSARTVKENGEEDILYRTNDDRYRLYDKTRDGPAFH